MAATRKNLLARIVTPGGDNPLLLRLVSPKVVRRGVAVSGLSLVATGGAGGYVYSIVTSSVTGDLPPGLTLNSSTGAITGTPTAQGHYLFVAQVQDSSATVYTASFSITVQSSLVWSQRETKPGELTAVFYFFQFLVSGATGAVTWSIVSGNLPAGLSLDSSTGFVSGFPDPDSNGLGGRSYFTIRATDSGSGDYLDISTSIFIYDLLTAVGFPDAEPTIIRGAPFSLTFQTTGGHPIKTFKLSGSPFTTSRVVFNARTGTLSGTTFIPAGDYSVGVICTDALGAFFLVLVLFHVIDSNESVVVQENSVDVGDPGLSVLNFVEGSGVSIGVVASGGQKTVTISSTGGGGSGVASVGGALPDSSGNVGVYSPDASVDVGVDSSVQPS